MPGGVDMCVCTQDSDFIPVVLLICCAVALLCLVCVTHTGMKGESESVSFLSPVKTRFTYGPTIVAIAQGSFARRQIWRRD